MIELERIMHGNKVDQRLWGVKEEMFLWAVGKRKLYKKSSYCIFEDSIGLGIVQVKSIPG